MRRISRGYAAMPQIPQSLLAHGEEVVKKLEEAKEKGSLDF